MPDTHIVTGTSKDALDAAIANERRLSRVSVEFDTGAITLLKVGAIARAFGAGPAAAAAAFDVYISSAAKKDLAEALAEQRQAIKQIEAAIAAADDQAGDSAELVDGSKIRVEMPPVWAKDP